MAYRIKASPDDLRQTANVVEQVAQGFADMQQRANGQVDFLQSHWRGEASSKFQASYGELKGVMGQVNAALSGMAGSLRGAAESLAEAEEEARRRATAAFTRGNR